MAYGQKSRGGSGNSGLWVGYRSIKNGVVEGRVTKKPSTRGGTKSSSKRPRAASRKPYTPVEYPSNKSAYFNSAQSWEDRESQLIEGIKNIQFLADFDISDKHIDAIVALGPSICHTLLDFRVGDAETGQGGQLSDASIITLAQACPNLIHIKLDGARSLTDASFSAILANCPNLQYIQFSGNDRNAGRLTGTALDTLRENPGLGKMLVKLRLTDQIAWDKKFDTALKKLSSARKKLAIEVGNTHERRGEVNTWLGGKEKYGYQAFGGPGGFNQYGGFGGFW